MPFFIFVNPLVLCYEAKRFCLMMEITPKNLMVIMTLHIFMHICYQVGYIFFHIIGVRWKPIHMFGRQGFGNFYRRGNGKWFELSDSSSSRQHSDYFDTKHIPFYMINYYCCCHKIKLKGIVLFFQRTKLRHIYDFFYLWWDHGHLLFLCHVYLSLWHEFIDIIV